MGADFYMNPPGGRHAGCKRRIAQLEEQNAILEGALKLIAHRLNASAAGGRTPKSCASLKELALAAIREANG